MIRKFIWNKDYNLLLFFFIYLSIILYLALLHTVVNALVFNYYRILIIHTTVTLIIYICVYTIRCIPKSIPSFIWFNCNFILLSLFILGFIRLYKGLSNPIHIEDLSTFSIYRYTFFLIITLLGLIIYLLGIYIPYIQSFITRINFPYLKEEIRVILYTWNDPYLGDVCTYLIDNLHSSKRFRYILMFIHLLFRGFIPLTQVLLFLNFVLNAGDLRYNIYLLPLSFISWIFAYLEYYFKTFFDGTVEYLRLVLSVTSKELLTPIELGESYILRSGNDLNFVITEYGLNEGLIPGPNNTGLIALANLWLQLSQLSYFLKRYYNNIFYFRFMIVALRIFSWIIINTTFIPGKEYDMGFWDKSFVFVKSTIRPNTRPYVTQAYTVKKKHQNAMENATNGVHKKGHIVVVDPDVKNESGHILFEGGGTHGTGPIQNPSAEVNSTKDLSGNNKPQNIVFPQTTIYVNPLWLDKSIPNSTQFFEQNEVKLNMAKNKKEEENT